MVDGEHQIHPRSGERRRHFPAVVIVVANSETADAEDQKQSARAEQRDLVQSDLLLFPNK